MENNKDIKKKKSAGVLRVAISKENSTLVDAWLKQIAAYKEGISVKRSELVNWLIAEKGKDLKRSDLLELEKKYFDEILYAKSVVKQLSLAKQRGETLSFDDVVRSFSRTKTNPKKSPKKVLKVSKEVASPESKETSFNVQSSI